MLTYLLTLPGKQSSTCMPNLHQSSASIPQQIALAYPSRCKSSWSQQSEQSLVMHPSTYCVTQTAQQRIQPQTTMRQTAPPCQPHQQSQLWQPPDGQAGSTNQPQSTGKCPCSPWGGSMSHPRPPSLQLLSLNVNGLRERQKRAALFAVLQAGPWHVIALQETHHATQAEAAQWCREGAGRPYRPMGRPVILVCWHVSQPRRGLVVQGLSPSVRGLSLCCGPVWQIRHDFGSFFLFITVGRYIHWLAMLHWTFRECSLLCWRYLVEGGVKLLSGLSSFDGRSDAEACGTHSPRGDQSNPPQ